MHGNIKLIRHVEFLGYCCPKEFFRTHERFTTEELSGLLGVSPRTIRFWKVKVKSLSPCKTCLHI